MSVKAIVVTGTVGPCYTAVLSIAQGWGTPDHLSIHYPRGSDSFLVVGDRALVTFIEENLRELAAHLGEPGASGYWPGATPPTGCHVREIR